jgi:uncharacterized protein (UPF0333 family)
MSRFEKKFKRDKRGQVSDTMTWVVATLIIIVILLVFIYASSVFAKAKGIGRFAKDVFSSGDYEVEVDWIKAKTSFAYRIIQGNKAMIDEWINENEAQEG